jgi:hypothetical protein
MPGRLRSYGFALALAVAALLVLGPTQASASGMITISVSGQGSATGEGINCTQSGGPDCSEFYDDISYQECDPELRPPCFTITEPPVVDVTAGADANGFSFSGWQGCDSVSERTCTHTVTEDETLTAVFADNQPPSVSAPTPTGGIRQGTFTIAATAGDNAGVARVEFRVRGALIGTDTSAPYEVSYNSALVPDGTATLRATAFDAAGKSSFAESTITIDNHAPAVSITSGPNDQTFGPGTTQTWTFNASDTTLASVQCSVVATGTAPSFGSCSGGSGSHTVTNRPDGSYVFAVRARDGLNRETIAQREFSIDATGPDVSITKGPKPKTTKKRASFSFEASEPNSTFECSLDGGAFTECFSPRKFSVKRGRHRFLVRATDPLGNVGPATTYKWRVVRG